jgi:hypothetical protein
MNTKLLRRFLILLVTLLIAAPTRFTGSAKTSITEITRISVSSGGEQGNSDSLSASISADGRYTTFFSLSDNFFSGDSNGAADVFLHDTVTNMTRLVSTTSSGEQGDLGSHPTGISADGNLVAFSTISRNIVGVPMNFTSHVFVHNMGTGTTTIVSVTSSGTLANGSTFSGTLSDDGRYIVYDSLATNLVSGDTNGKQDVFVHDLNTGTTRRISVGPGGVQGNNPSIGATISGNGRYVAFISSATNLVNEDTNGNYDVFRYDMQTGEMKLVSISSSGEQGNGSSNSAALSEDGRYVAFESLASNLVSGDTNAKADVFIHDMATGETILLSTDSSGTQGNNDSYPPVISDNGRFVAFDSIASNLVSGDNNGFRDIFLHDVATGETRRISVDASGTEGNGNSYFPSISDDGKFVAFESDASNLVSGDTNGRSDVFLYPVPTPTALYNLTVNKTGAGNGTVTSNPAGIVCGDYCTYDFAKDTSVTLTAMPAGAQDQFTGWSGGGCSGNGTCTVTMDQARSVSAAFTLPSFDLSVSLGGSGTVTSQPDGIDCGATCAHAFLNGTSITLTATPASIYDHFTGWSGDLNSAQNPVEFIISQEMDITATFTNNLHQIFLPLTIR